jgi:hypothetical protein
MSNFTTGSYVWEREDHDFLKSLPEAPMQSAEWKAFSRPAEVTVDWHHTENQGQIGSCQGNDLSSVLERLAHVRGEEVQLSRIFAYLATQKLDGLLGSDDGSTISGGCKLAVEVGVCPESLTGYPRSYPDRNARTRILSAENYAAGALYKALSAWQVPGNHDETLDFIGGGGGISFGIQWYNGLIPQDRIVRSYRPGMTVGGHANCILGYTKDGDYRAMNSWGDGPYIITQSAWSQMLKYNRTSAIGLMGNKEAKPVDWYENSPWYKMRMKP